MGLFDWFVGELTCPSCGAVSAADGRTNAQTKLHAHPRQHELAAGDELVFDRAGAVDAGYVPLGPEPDRDVRLLQNWECPSCPESWLWLQVTVREGRIHSVESVVLDAEVLASAHYIEEDALVFEAARRADRGSLGMGAEEALRLLRDALEGPPGPLVT